MKNYFIIAFASLAMLSCTTDAEDVTVASEEIIEESARASRAEVCGRYARIRRDRFHINNNIWNQEARGAGRQCVWANNMNSWGADASHRKGGGDIKSYPSIIVGDHWGDKTRTSDLPRRIRDLGRVNTQWTQRNNFRAGNVSYDIWFDPSRNPGNRAAKFELMIWLNWKNQNPIAHRYDSRGNAVPVERNVRLGGKTYHVYRKGNVFSFLRTQKVNSMRTDVKPFIDYCVRKRWMSNSNYMTSIQAGWEVIEGGTFSTSSFSVRDIKR